MYGVNLNNIIKSGEYVEIRCSHAMYWDTNGDAVPYSKGKRVGVDWDWIEPGTALLSLSDQDFSNSPCNWSSIWAFYDRKIVKVWIFECKQL